MRNELKRLQAAMRRDGTDIWLIPCRDAHGSEYIGDRDKCTEALSGFTGDSCVMAVFKEEAYLWTDGRYFEQAEKELSGSGVGLMKMGEKGVHTPGFSGEQAGKRADPGLLRPAVQCHRGEKLPEALRKEGGLCPDGSGPGGALLGEPAGEKPAAGVVCAHCPRRENSRGEA